MRTYPPHLHLSHPFQLRYLENELRDEKLMLAIVNNDNSRMFVKAQVRRPHSLPPGVSPLLTLSLPPLLALSPLTPAGPTPPPLPVCP